MPRSVDHHPADAAASPWPTGRQREWIRLADRFAAVHHGDGGVVTISGEAGIGKTELIRSLTNEVRRQGTSVLFGGCYDLAITPPYGPWREAFAMCRPDGDAAALPAMLREPSSSGVDSSQALFEQVSSLLARIASTRPLILVLEDLHWADSASLDLLRFVGRRLNGVPLVLVATWRDDDLSPRQPLHHVLPALVRESNPLRIELQRLDGESMRGLVTRRYSLADADRETLGDWVQGRADGNPFFAGEVLLALEQSGALVDDAGTWRFSPPAAFAVPPLARQVIEARLSRLSESTQRLLEYAAIVGQEASIELVHAAADVSEEQLATAIEDATSSRVVEEAIGDELSLRFTHALVRETLYARQSILRRRARHRRVAEQLLTGPSPAAVELGYHFQAANDPRSVEWLANAGMRSLALHAPRDAIEQLTRADELAQRFGAELPAAAIRARGQAWEMAGEYARAREDYETCLRFARKEEDRRPEWQALLDLGAFWTARDYDQAGGLFRQALALARSHLDDSAIAHSLNAVGNWHGNVEEPDLAVECHREALSIFTRLNDIAGVAATRDLLGMTFSFAGEPSSAAREWGLAVSLLAETGDQMRLTSALASWSAMGGNYEADPVVVVPHLRDRWLALNEQSRAISREIGWLAGQAYADIQAGGSFGPRGQMDQALARAGAGHSLAERIGHRQWTTFGNWVLGKVYTDLLDERRARTRLELAVSDALAIGSRLWRAMSFAALGMLLVDAGELDAAAELVEPEIDSERPAMSLGGRHLWLTWVRLLVARGEPERALTAIDQIEERSRRPSGSHAVPWFELVRGDALFMLGRISEAETSYEAARNGAFAIEYRHVLWRVDLAHARLLTSTGRGAGALEAEALTTIKGIAATIPAEEERIAYWARMRKWWPDVPSALPESGSEGGLSPREIEVLRLVTLGLTDAEVGERLFISHRTVGRHLQSIYNKLGVSTRTAAVTFAFDHGLFAREDRV